MTLQQLEYFVRVAELGSFSKASVVLRIGQSSLSRQIRSLETELRQTLFVRTGRGVSLTENGGRLLEHSIGILELVTRAREDMECRRGELGGRLVVGLPPSLSRLLTPRLVETFKRELPRARLVLVEGLSAHIGEWIASGRVDVGLMHNPEAQAGIETTPVLEEELCLIGPTTSARTRKRAVEVPISDLPRYRLIVPEQSHVIRRLLDSQAAISGINLDIAWEVSSVPAILDLVLAGHGYAVMSEHAAAAWGHAKELEVRPLTRPSLRSTLCVCVASHRKPSILIKRSMRLLPELILKSMTHPKPS
jgi:LysR family transcriptional regulator, nitrogen assimilation regulatory protein